MGPAAGSRTAAGTEAAADVRLRLGGGLRQHPHAAVQLLHHDGGRLPPPHRRRHVHVRQAVQLDTAVRDRLRPVDRMDHIDAGHPAHDGRRERAGDCIRGDSVGAVLEGAGGQLLPLHGLPRLPVCHAEHVRGHDVRSGDDGARAGMRVHHRCRLQLGAIPAVGVDAVVVWRGLPVRESVAGGVLRGAHCMHLAVLQNVTGGCDAHGRAEQRRWQRWSWLGRRGADRRRQWRHAEGGGIRQRAGRA
mmetsp:Transcript_11053/g.31752  ORF Transcript_11053/g.31752 Transcript_11053/m.31752 type:complete len:246 (-) Transcript_11053:390-1127(-)